MKKNVKILIVILLIILIAAISYILLFGKNNKHNIIDSETALEIAKEKYERLLNYTSGNYINLSSEPSNSECYSWEDDVYYLKIDNYKETIENDITDDFKSDFNYIAQIIEKDGIYYINTDSLSREKDQTYISTQLIVTSVNADEIICEAQSTYRNYVDNVTNKISRKFILKKVNENWKVSKFELPY